MTERAETGGPNRTPRSEITTVRKHNRSYEPVCLLDLSTSMDWGAEDEGSDAQLYPSPQSRRAIVIAALPMLVKALASEDSEAEKEQADGSDELGGLLTFGFAGTPVEIGDLNESNLERRLNSIQWGGGTLVVPALKLALKDYADEFEDDEDDSRVHEIIIITDGQASDWQQLEPYLLAADANRVYVVAIVGHGDKALATYSEYKKVAEENRSKDKFGKEHVHVVLFDGVTDPAEIGEDLVTLAG
jgi:hypothetical protein